MKIAELKDPFAAHRRVGRMVYWAARRLLRGGLRDLRREGGAGNAPILDYGRFLTGPVRGRALLSYQSDAFGAAVETGGNWSNRTMCRSLGMVLNRLGYLVDVVDWSDLNFQPRASYEIFVGMGRNYRRLCDLLPPATKCVFWATRSHHSHERDAQRQRLDELARRRGIRLAPLAVCRSTDEQPEASRTQAVIAVGNAVTTATYEPLFARVYPIHNIALPGLGEVSVARNYASARRHFLCLVSDGLVLKGLDLALEAFGAMPEAELWVCGPLRADLAFRKVYRRELFYTPNIHPVGWVDMRSPVFTELVARCAASVFFSCSEGMSGSVLNTMRVGLVPIVSAACGVDVQECGFVVQPCTVEGIRARVTTALQMSSSEYERLSACARDRSGTTYGLASFETRLQEILREVGEA